MRYAISVLAAVSFLACASAALADGYDPTTLTAAQIFKKSDAAYGSLAPGTYQEIVRVHAGGVDRTETTLISGDDYRTTYEGGGFTSADGEYEKQDWRQDQNGIVTLESNFRAKVDPNDLALEHPSDPKYNVRVLGMTQTAPSCYVVEINPPGGFDQLRYFDAKRFLLVRTVSYTRDRYRHVTDYSDFRTVFGETFAFLHHSYDGRPQNDDTRTVVSFQRAAPAADITIPQSTPIFSNDVTKPIRLPVRFTSDGIVVRAVVDGRGLDFLLDSGADGLFIDPGIAHQLGLTPFGRSSETVGGGDVDMGSVRIPHMTIGSLDLSNVVFTTSPFDDQTRNARIVGLMGFDLLASGIFGIDFKAQTVTLYPRAQFAPKAHALVALPLQLDDGVPRADVWVDGVHGHFAVDTGSFGILVYNDFVNRLHTAVPDDENLTIGTVGGAMRTRVVTLTNLDFGSVRYRSAEAVEPERSTFDIRDYDGLLGRDVLANYQCYFDYGDGTLFVKPNL